MTFNDQTFDVWFTSSLDYLSRTLRLVFQSIDPATSLPPDVLTGFLPPEDGTGRGRGFVTYTIHAVLGLSTGAAIRNIALISFDIQVFIATNQVDPLHPELGTDPSREALVTIDAGPPTSSVLPLPVQSFNPAISVRWAGSDDGSGVARYSVFVSTDGGGFVPWLTDTTQTQGVYSGAVGHAYAFYSVATDNVGHAQPTPAAAQASTLVVAAPNRALPAPYVQAVGINDGHAQRSMVNSIVITFDQRVTLEAGAMTLVRRGGGEAFTLVVTNENGDGRTYTLRFSGGGITGGSLADGVYDLVVHAALVRNARGGTLEEDQTLTFHRLFGDSNGDRTVDALDMALLRSVLGRTNADPDYLWWMDFDQNGSILGSDGLQVRTRLGVRFTY